MVLLSLVSSLVEHYFTTREPLRQFSTKDGTPLTRLRNVIKRVLKKIVSVRIEKQVEHLPDPMDSSHKTATRYTLAKDWQAMRDKTDWMSVPSMPDYVNGLVSGRPLSDQGHWAVYARDKYVLPMCSKRNGRLEMVSLACGSGHIEEALVKEFDWPITRFLGLEYDDLLRASAADRFARIPGCQSRFEFFNFNAPDFPNEQFDILFACHSIHHAINIEGLLVMMNRMLKLDGLIIGLDYFGPTRFQIEYEVLPIIQELFSYLPPRLRRNLSTPDTRVEDHLTFDTIAAVRENDPSESVRSSDLRTLLFSSFPIIEIKPMGGTLLRWLFYNRAGNFNPNNPEDVTIIRLLQLIERELILLRRIQSDDLFFVLGKSDRLQGEIFRRGLVTQLISPSLP